MLMSEELYIVCIRFWTLKKTNNFMRYASDKTYRR